MFRWFGDSRTGGIRMNFNKFSVGLLGSKFSRKIIWTREINNLMHLWEKPENFYFNFIFQISISRIIYSHCFFCDSLNSINLVSMNNTLQYRAALTCRIVRQNTSRSYQWFRFDTNFEMFSKYINLSIIFFSLFQTLIPINSPMFKLHFYY